MKVSDYIATYIESKGVKTVFEITGGMITHLLDSFLQKTQVTIVTAITNRPLPLQPMPAGG